MAQQVTPPVEPVESTKIPVTDGSEESQPQEQAQEQPQSQETQPVETPEAETAPEDKPEGQEEPQPGPEQPEGTQETTPPTEAQTASETPSETPEPDNATDGKETVEAPSTESTTTAPASPATYQPAQVQDFLARLFSEVETLTEKTRNLLGSSVDTKELEAHLVNARDWLGERIHNIEKDANGSWKPVK